MKYDVIQYKKDTLNFFKDYDFNNGNQLDYLKRYLKMVKSEYTKKYLTDNTFDNTEERIQKEIIKIKNLIKQEKQKLKGE